jgi:putative intracellular protease/amidase
LEGKPEIKSEALEFWNNNVKFSTPMSLEKAIENADDYIGIVIPGGQGLMVDLIYDTKYLYYLNFLLKIKKLLD